MHPPRPTCRCERATSGTHLTSATAAGPSADLIWRTFQSMIRPRFDPGAASARRVSYMRFIARRAAAPIQGFVDYCGVSGNYVLIAGWALHAGAELDAVELHCDRRAIGLSSMTIVRGARPDVTTRHPDADKP